MIKILIFLSYGYLVHVIINQSKHQFAQVFSWGLGHSTPLIIIGLLVLTIRDSIIEFYEPISDYFELLVALMLIFLGLQVFWKPVSYTHLTLPTNREV